ncbi:NACHT domain-containing protein [Streptomyces sp. NPDC000134]|uniref:NACHT domain-containing protein n=1 Tax=Streptomyces sp. NPDC000134 TaxID=3364536 RepID=UPI0036C51EFE
MIGGRALDRVVAVLADGQGSGVLLDPRHVLTAWHVVGSGAVEAIHPSARSTTACTVIWESKAHDVAVLRADSPLVSAERAAPMGRLRVGRVATPEPLPHCQIVGFPEIQRYGEEGEDLEYDQYRVSVLPMAGRMRRTLVCELDRPPADEAGRRDSPLQGLSGAPVFAGAVLLGIVTEVPRDRLHLRVEATPFEAMAKASAEEGKVRFDIDVEDVTDVHPRDERFEARYAEDLSSQYRKTEIFGIDELGRGEARWDLDTAYLSLEAEPAHEDDVHRSERLKPAASSHRIDTLLADRPRALLRGEAGAGKTTLVWWLAAHAANATLNENLAELNGLVPFVIPLREVHARGGKFPAVPELLSAGRVLTDSAPSGWVRRVLEAGRGLLLVDGLDEVPEDRREEARRWLAVLLDRYPRTRCLATVRPNAVDKDWLAPDGFTELTLRPMSDEDIRSFVQAWHAAARIECDLLFTGRRQADERDQLTSLEESLLHQLDENTALRELARTPLLCAVICALHRRRGGLLPTTRWSLYRAALAMLLGGRDAARGVRNPDDLALDSDEQHALLQRLAIWLVRTGQQQMTHAIAVQQLELAMRDMPQISSQAAPARVLRFLLERSGLLRERTDDAIQFIHRTFQEFLAAKEFHESGYILELLDRADKEEWQDVIVLAVGHATRRDANELIGKLVDFGEAAEHREKRWHLLILAARCATSLLSLDAALSDRVRESVRGLMPPQSYEEAMEMAGLGDWAVDVLPSAEEVVDAEATVFALTHIRSPRARRAIRAFVSNSEGHIVRLIVRGWALHPIGAYAHEVLAGMHVPYLSLEEPDMLPHLPLFGSLRHVSVDTSFSAEELDTYLPTAGLKRLDCRNCASLNSLAFLRSRTELEHLELGVISCGLDLSVLSDLPLASIALHMGGVPVGNLSVLPQFEALHTLRLNGVPDGGWGGLAAHPGVQNLSVYSTDTSWLSTLPYWMGLESLVVDSGTRDVPEILTAVGARPRISGLTLRVHSLSALTAPGALAHVRRLTLTRLIRHSDTSRVRALFPELNELTFDLQISSDRETPLDLTPFADLPGLRVIVRGLVQMGFEIRGKEALGDRFTDDLIYMGPAKPADE